MAFEAAAKLMNGIPASMMSGFAAITPFEQEPPTIANTCSVWISLRTTAIALAGSH